MATFTERLAIIISADAKGAIAGIKETEVAAGKLDATTGRMSQTLSKVGTYAKLGGVAAAAAITVMAFKGIEDFVNLTASVRQYQRILGGTAEENSKLAAQLRIIGVDSEIATKGFGILAKNIGNGTDTLVQWGVKVTKTKDGNIDLVKTLLNIGDTYKTIADPTQKAAFLAQNFGRSYQALIPFLSKSREELRAFGQEADKNHEIFNQDQLDQGKEYSVTLREMKASVQGLALALGEDLVPIVDTLTKFVIGAVHGIDDLGRSLGYAHLSAVAFGAALGTAVAPGIGTLIGAGIGLAASFLGGADAAQELADDVHKLVQAYETGSSGSKALAHDFDSLTKKVLENRNAVADATNDNKHFGVAIGDTMAQQAIHITNATASWIAFKQIAHENLGVASLVIDSLKEQGVNTDGYARLLFTLAGRKRDDNALTFEAAKANEYLTTTIDDVQSALLKAAGGELGFQQAQIDVKKATDDLNVALFTHGENSDEAKEASLRLQVAQLNLARSAIDLGAATEDLTKRYQGNEQAAQDEVNRLKDLQAKYPEAASALQPLIDRTQDYINKLHNVPTDVTTYLDLIAKLRLEIAAITATVGFDENGQPVLLTYAGGGVVPGPEGAARLAMVHGGETVFTPDQLDALVAAGGGSKGAGEYHFHYNQAPEDPVLQARLMERSLRSTMWLIGR